MDKFLLVLVVAYLLFAHFQQINSNLICQCKYSNLQNGSILPNDDGIFDNSSPQQIACMLDCNDKYGNCILDGSIDNWICENNKGDCIKRCPS